MHGSSVRLNSLHFGQRMILVFASMFLRLEDCLSDRLFISPPTEIRTPKRCRCTGYLATFTSLANTCATSTRCSSGHYHRGLSGFPHNRHQLALVRPCSAFPVAALRDSRSGPTGPGCILMPRLKNYQFHHLPRPCRQAPALVLAGPTALEDMDRPDS